MPRVKIEELRKQKRDNSGEKIKSQIARTREIQEKRFIKTKPRIRLNSEMSSKQTDETVKFSPDAEIFLKNILEKSFISARGYYRILKISQTIADLEGEEKVSGNHLAEAFQYRIREKE